MCRPGCVVFDDSNRPAYRAPATFYFSALVVLHSASSLPERYASEPTQTSRAASVRLKADVVLFLDPGADVAGEFCIRCNERKSGTGGAGERPARSTSSADRWNQLGFVGVCLDLCRSRDLHCFHRFRARALDLTALAPFGFNRRTSSAFRCSSLSAMDHSHTAKHFRSSLIQLSERHQSRAMAAFVASLCRI